MKVSLLLAERYDFHHDEEMPDFIYLQDGMK